MSDSSAFLRPATRAAIQLFWRAVQAEDPYLRDVFLEAHYLVEEDMMDEVFTCKCGHAGPKADFMGVKALTKKCKHCRAAYKGPKGRAKAASKAIARPVPLAQPAPPKGSGEPALAPATTETITLTLSPPQAEKVLELTLKDILERDPHLLAKSIPGLLDLLVEG